MTTGDRILEIIKTNNLTKKFNGFTAVDHISFSVRKEEIFGFLGPNGAGKTTTIKMLTTLLHPTEGSAELSGFDIIKKRDKVREQIGVVFQDPALDTELTGRENLDFHARMYGLDKENRKKRAAEVLKLVDLEEKKDVLVKNYSGGMKRRLEIARGLMHYPTVLFLDEPTLGLDAQTRRAIWEYIKKMNKEEKTTIFLTTHYMDEADYLCDRVGIIDRGKILVMDSTNNLKNDVGNDVITLSCSNLDELCKRLGEESWIKNIKQHDTFLTLGVKKGEEKIPVVFEIARNLNIKIKSISVRKPTLDDVFLHFTGRTMRDQEKKDANIENLPPRLRSRGR
ncbi:MAG: ATP-binding cassette domain-containing protein [Thermoplasmatales archaeon]|nr:ATP-binding cassette domain-containing protein [Thermoplasmatales archaeon]MCK5261885.1 ATP-binding cassette domain-containing protein [Thermoplasmatales archaeon]